MPRKTYLSRGKEQKLKKKEQNRFPDILMKVLNESDIILQILDARFIQETRNPSIEDIIKKQNKKIIFVINKSDLTDNINKKELEKIKPYVMASAKSKQGLNELRTKIKITAKSLNKDRVHLGVIGYPNTGKSSIINALSRKGSAKTASQAGFTKGIQKIRLMKGITLLDSPGVIPRKEYSTNTQAQANQAKLNARTYDKVKDPEFAVFNIMKTHSQEIQDHYKIQAKDDTEILIEKLGRKLNYLKKGNKVDVNRTAKKILKDWQEGEIKI